MQMSTPTPHVCTDQKGARNTSRFPRTAPSMRPLSALHAPTMCPLCTHCVPSMHLYAPAHPSRAMQYTMVLSPPSTRSLVVANMATSLRVQILAVGMAPQIFFWLAADTPSPAGVYARASWVPESPKTTSLTGVRAENTGATK